MRFLSPLYSELCRFSLSQAICTPKENKKEQLVSLRFPEACWTNGLDQQILTRTVDFSG